MKATFFVLNEPDFFGNRIFGDEPINGVKNYGFMFAALRQQLAAHGIDLATQDIHPPEDSELIIALDEVDFFRAYQRRPGQRIYLLINEPNTYFPEVWDKANHGVFNRIFTYDYTLANSEKYIHYNFAINLNAYPPFQGVTEAEFNERKLLVLMAGMFEPTKPVPPSQSLLYTRYRTLRWFGEHCSQEFDFYSRGIDPVTYSSFRGLGVLQRLLPQALAEQIVRLVSTRRRNFFERVNLGPVPPNDKLTVIRQYRFAVCYENTRQSGYISEKMFDCLYSSCVPVYLGEPAIQQFIPEQCYINREAFASDAELANFLRSMTYTEYARYITAIEQFIGGVERNKFSSEDNAARISSVILTDLKAQYA